jgi:hypothetical protein
MNKRGIAGALLLAAGLTGCDKISEKIPFLGKKKEAPPPVAVAPAPVDTTPAEPPPEVVRETPPAPRPAAVDEPWEPVDTGTVNPGMTRDEVVAVWGPPVAEREQESWSYLYFRNGCEVTCGTFDVVFLENGQVVDAVVRGTGHTYAGNSSSPPGRIPEATTGQLTVPVDAPASPETPQSAPSGEGA